MTKLLRTELREVLSKYSKEELRRGWLDDDPKICRILQHIGEVGRHPRDTKKVKVHILVWEGYETVRDFYEIQ